MTEEKSNPVASGQKVNVIASSSGATVWAAFANFEGSFEANPSNGWSHLFNHLHTFEEVIDDLDKANLRGGVSHLALVAHNELGRAGAVTYGSPIVWDTVPLFDELFNRLGLYLRSDSMLSFYSCVSGAGREGDDLLKAVSIMLPGRTIVAFCTYLQAGKSGTNAPGNVCGQTYSTGPCDPDLFPLTPSFFETI